MFDDGSGSVQELSTVTGLAYLKGICSQRARFSIIEDFGSFNSILVMFYFPILIFNNY